jgi:hypothetical protein
MFLAGASFFQGDETKQETDEQCGALPTPCLNQQKVISFGQEDSIPRILINSQVKLLFYINHCKSYPTAVHTVAYYAMFTAGDLQNSKPNECGTQRY